MIDMNNPFGDCIKCGAGATDKDGLCTGCRSLLSIQKSERSTE